ncbi:hypothetical protein RX327_18955 [Bradyrhizobium sp. BEA-2-5]|uniref:hypothetical protein n=1 Tax=Bradyrhizobium sp. BEA-2-5 TaxID=3080015 RepID=UPI00293E51F0|nr:hypothetical protein [Bradyrhizobium sp. BEA-2-5]WOH85071.1 hypothetical protein RX327_18955 [Bradyrhizobium sp. BEA-2-5]
MIVVVMVVVTMIVVAMIVVVMIMLMLMVLVMRMIMRLMFVAFLGDHAVIVVPSIMFMMLGIDGMFVGLDGGQRLRVVRALDHLALDALAMTAAAGVAVARTAAAVRAVLALFLGLAMGLFLGLDQRLPVGDRDLIIVGMDFAEGEEAVAIAAIFDEGGLERGFDPCDLGEVDIPAQLLALRGFEIKLFDAIAADHDDPGLFRVGGIDQHLVGHVLTLGGGGRDKPWARIAPPGDATVHLIRG